MLPMAAMLKWCGSSQPTNYSLKSTLSARYNRGPASRLTSRAYRLAAQDSRPPPIGLSISLPQSFVASGSPFTRVARDGATDGTPEKHLGQRPLDHVRFRGLVLLLSGLGVRGLWHARIKPVCCTARIPFPKLI